MTREWKKGDRGVIAYMHQGKIRMFDPVLKKDVTPPTGPEKGTQEAPLRRPKATVPATKRFVFDGVKWTCAKCGYTSPSKETMKSHHRRQHLPLPDRTIETKPRAETPRPDRKVEDAEPWELD